MRTAIRVQRQTDQPPHGGTADQPPHGGTAARCGRGAGAADRAGKSGRSTEAPVFAPQASDVFPSRSLSAALSSTDSANSVFSRRFSSSNALRRRVSETSRPPYFALHLLEIPCRRDFDTLKWVRQAKLGKGGRDDLKPFAGTQRVTSPARKGWPGCGARYIL